MKILMLLSNPIAETYRDPRVYKETKRLIGASYKVTIFCWDRECKYPIEELYERIKVVRIRSHSKAGSSIFQVPALTKFLIKAVRLIFKEDFNIIHCHDIETLLAGYILSKRKKIPLIFDAHEPIYGANSHYFRTILKTAALILEHILVRKTDRVIVAHDFSIEKYKKMGARHIFLVPNYPEKSLTEKIIKSESHNKSFVIGRVGALHLDAGIEGLIDAFKSMQKNYSNLSLFIAGHGTEQMLKTVRQKIGSNPKNMTFIPGYHQHELPLLYSKIDISVFSDKLSGWRKHVAPTKFFESLAFGVPVVTTDIGEIGKIIQQEHCGVLLKESSSEAIVNALKIILDNPNCGDLLKQMGENGKKAIRKKYNWDVSVKELLAAYESLKTL